MNTLTPQIFLYALCNNVVTQWSLVGQGTHIHHPVYHSHKRLRKLVTIDREFRLSYSLESIEAQLPTQQFVHTHKSCIVSVSYISSIGQSELTVAGTSLPVARRVRPGLYKRFAKLC